MKTLLDKIDASDIVARVKELTPTQVNLWGKMNAVEMLRHSNIINERLLETEGQCLKSSFKQLIIKALFLYLIPHFPKNKNGPKSAITIGMVAEDLFNDEKQLCIDLVMRFPEHIKPITVRHPMFGCLSTKEWGYAAWKHLDHHLRQFGV